MPKMVKPDDIATRARQYLKESNELLRRNDLAAALIVNFPGKKSAPLLSRFALWLVAKQGGRLDMQFGDMRKE